MNINPSQGASSTQPSDDPGEDSLGISIRALHQKLDVPHQIETSIVSILLPTDAHQCEDMEVGKSCEVTNGVHWHAERKLVPSSSGTNFLNRKLASSFNNSQLRISAS